MTNACTITKALGGKWYGHYGVAFCPAHDNTRTPALSLNDGENGLLLRCHAGCEFASIMAALRSLNLVEGGNWNVAPDPEKTAAHRANAQAKAEMMAGQAFKLWKKSQPIDGTLAETYLKERGIRRPCVFRGRWAAISRDHGHAFHAIVGSHFTIVDRLADANMESVLTGLVKWFRSGVVLSHAFSSEGEPMGVMHEAVEDGVGQGRVAHGLVPVFDRELAGDDRGASPVAVFEDLQQVAALRRGQDR